MGVDVCVGSPQCTVSGVDGRPNPSWVAQDTEINTPFHPYLYLCPLVWISRNRTGCRNNCRGEVSGLNHKNPEKTLVSLEICGPRRRTLGSPVRLPVPHRRGGSPGRCPRNPGRPSSEAPAREPQTQNSSVVWGFLPPREQSVCMWEGRDEPLRPLGECDRRFCGVYGPWSSGSSRNSLKVNRGNQNRCVIISRPRFKTKVLPEVSIFYGPSPHTHENRDTLQERAKPSVVLFRVVKRGGPKKTQNFHGLRITKRVPTVR